MSGRDMCYALPELQQWESAQVANYVWGAPGTIDGLGEAMDTAGAELTEIADSLRGVDVSGFWTGPAAEAFTALRDRVEPAVRGLGSMHRDAGAALGTWQRHLAVYQEDCGTAISTGRQGWQLYRTTSCTNPDAQTKMNAGKSGITNATGSRDGSGRTCRTALEAAVAEADVPTAPPARTDPPVPAPAGPGQVGHAPSGQEPVPFTGPVPPGQERPYVDPSNGRIVVPLQGPYLPGQRPWVYPTG